MGIETGITFAVFMLTMLMIFWRPIDMHEAWPASIGAAMIFLTGMLSFEDILDIINKIGGASITIIATITMAVILESFGFFHWAAARLGALAKGSGLRLYWYIQMLCFLMTVLFNNDGSILITTPILMLLLKNLGLKPHRQIPYLLTGALTATASSAPIGVSNIVNLISLEIVDMNLYTLTALMFVPATLGLVFMSWLMFIIVKSSLPKKLPALLYDLEEAFFTKNFHPLKRSNSTETKRKRTVFMMKILLFVLLIRCLLFVASFLQVPIAIVAICGSLVLLFYRWHHLRTNPADILKKTPWQIFVFAFSMYCMIYGLHNAGLTNLLVNVFEPVVDQGLFYASISMGGLVSLMSNLFNNHPALMVGTIALTEMGLDPVTLKTIYLANIIGSDMGSLLLPIGTLASLIWMQILRKNKIKVRWKDYLRVTVLVIPISTVFTLILLFYWVHLFFA